MSASSGGAGACRLGAATVRIHSSVDAHGVAACRIPSDSAAACGAHVWPGRQTCSSVLLYSCGQGPLVRQEKVFSQSSFPLRKADAARFFSQVGSRGESVSSVASSAAAPRSLLHRRLPRADSALTFHSNPDSLRRDPETKVGTTLVAREEPFQESNMEAQARLRKTSISSSGEGGLGDFDAGLKVLPPRPGRCVGGSGSPDAEAFTPSVRAQAHGARAKTAGRPEAPACRLGASATKRIKG